MARRGPVLAAAVTSAAAWRVFGARATIGPVPAALSAPVIDRPHLSATVDEALLRVPGVGRFHVRHGRRVYVEPAPAVPASTVEIWLHGVVAGLVLIQRRRFALHASAVRIGDRLVAIAGPSGAGKSTTVAALVRRGHGLVSDEVTAVHPRGASRRPTAYGSDRPLRLWRAAAERLAFDPDAAVEISPGKHAYRVDAAAGPGELGLVVALRVDGAVSRPTLVGLPGLSAVEAVLADTYRPVLRALWPQAHLRWAAAVAAAVPVVRVTRPAEGWSAEAVARAVERAAGRSGPGPPPGR